MASRKILTVARLMGLMVLAGCTPELPERVRAPDALPAVRRQAIDLQQALADGLVEVQVLAAQCSRTEMALRLNPLVTSQPWIRIDPGWVAQKPGASNAAFVTVETVYARLPQRNRFTVLVRNTALRPTAAESMPGNAQLVRFNNERLMAFLRKSGDQRVEPPWKLVQIAVWALVDDVKYARLKPPTKDKHLGFRGNTYYATAGQIDQVMRMLEDAGHRREEFALWRDMAEELERLVVRYEDDWDSDPVRAFIPFKEICNYYPLEVAADVMVSAFDRHEGNQGRDYRNYVVETLVDHGTRREIDILRRRANFESDPKILAAISKAVKEFESSAASPVR